MTVHLFKVGDYARNVDSGWRGKIVSLKTNVVKVDDTLAFAETTAEMVNGKDDRQWHSTMDLMPA